MELEEMEKEMTDIEFNISRAMAISDNSRNMILSLERQKKKLRGQIEAFK